MTRAPVLLALVLSLAACGGSSHRAAGCDHASRGTTDVRLSHFVVTGVIAHGSTEAGYALGRRGGFGVQPVPGFGGSVTLTAVQCSDGASVGLNSFGGTTATEPRPPGKARVTLRWPPPIESPPDPPSWLVTAFVHRAGLVSFTFSQHGKVLDRLTLDAQR